LLDTGLVPEEQAALRAALARHEGPEVQFHAVRTRQAAARRFVSLHVLVPGAWTVRRGHGLVERIEAEVRAVIPNATVFTHLEALEDPASFQDQGLDRILYVDLDAHHGDGVEDAFADDDRVLTISVHEAGRWPGTGRLADRAGGMARNLPVPAGFHDDELAAIVDAAILPLGRLFGPQAVVVQCGADALEDDPQSRLALGNRALWRAVAALLPLAPRVLVLGGGGYNPWSVARCWAGGLPTRDARPPAACQWRPCCGLSFSRVAGRHPPESWFTTWPTCCGWRGARGCPPGRGTGDGGPSAPLPAVPPAARCSPPCRHPCRRHGPAGWTSAARLPTEPMVIRRATAAGCPSPSRWRSAPSSR
jgi:hypothetical protein